jgi:hypothetical protein
VGDELLEAVDEGDAVDEEALAEVEVECEGEDKEYAGCEENVEGCFVHVF